ncbi:MAG: D-alanyl-D-alanine carboxypeptidase family protein [Bacillota bacterium]
MRSRLLGGQVSRRAQIESAGQVRGRTYTKVSRSGSSSGQRRPSGGLRSFARSAAIIGTLALITVAIRSGLFEGAVLPSISGKSAMVVDLETGKELVAIDANTRVYPASLTKLMTAILLAEHRSPGDLMRCSGAASLQEPTRLGLFPGSRLTAVAVMDAMLVGSANDAAYLAAEDIGGSVKDFAALMNAKAKELGMNQTNFVTPTGLDDQNHYSTARDLAVLFRAALSDPWVSKSLAKEEATVTASAPPPTADGPSPTATFTVENTNPLLGLDGCTAGKTGSTTQAGKCLAALFERDGRRIIAVVMGAPTTEALIEDVRAVVDAALDR